MATKKKLHDRVSRWLGTKPTECQLCGKSLTAFIDGAVRGIGSWALMCTGCFIKRGVGLGMGRGQLYRADLTKCLDDPFLWGDTREEQVQGLLCDDEGDWRLDESEGKND